MYLQPFCAVTYGNFCYVARYHVKVNARRISMLRNVAVADQITAIPLPKRRALDRVHQANELV